MALHIKIKNFGKVKTADILLSNLVVFVGNNNSGKTMVMQLIYGLRKELEDFRVTAIGAKVSDSNGQYLIQCNSDWFKEVELQINRYLAENKARIIESIFGVPILAEEIAVTIEGMEYTKFVSSVSEYQDRDSGEQKAGISIDILQYEDGKNTGSFKNRISAEGRSDDAMSDALNAVWRVILTGKADVDSGQLFLPASRSGLQLLYKHYFAGKTEGNLVMPIQDFLRFLQLYAENKKLEEARKALLEFGEEHLLQGKVIQEGDETFYIDKYGDRTVSLHIASSMIHELTPFIKALNATQQIDWLYCDEVENSLHPLMQREMARWLIRMANAGMHVLLSSHSDTMASRLNNLFMLTELQHKKTDYKRLVELDLVEADLLRSDVKVNVYEFQSEKEGKTTVTKVEFISHPLMGYEFQLFSKNLDKLYDEADRITR